MTIIDTPEPTTPERDLNTFLVAMSVALHRYSMYPSDPPSIGPRVDDVLRRANELLADRATTAFDVAHRQLIIDGVATDSNQPVLRRLAEAIDNHPRGEAYEHHVMLDGGGYPAMHYSRKCTFASRLVHVCDVYDALSTRRPYREAWESEKTTEYLEDPSGTEFDPELVSAFVKMLREPASAGIRWSRGNV